jgi:hypothetical protein
MGPNKAASLEWDQWFVNHAFTTDFLLIIRGSVVLYLDTHGGISCRKDLIYLQVEGLWENKIKIFKSQDQKTTKN